MSDIIERIKIMARCKKITPRKPFKVSFRLSPMEYNFIKELSETLQVSESEAIRMILLKEASNYMKQKGRILNNENET